MTAPALTEDEFRLLAYVRAYADHPHQSLDPEWVQKQLELPLDRLRAAARGLKERGLAEFFEWQPEDPRLMPSDCPDHGPMPMNLKLTANGWEYLRRDHGG